jgi:dTDP-4-amino-4,6-dideoxygalactose transaminase
VRAGRPARARLTELPYTRLPYTATGAELLGDEEQRNVLEVLRRRRLWRYELPSSESFVARFEAAAEELLGVRHVHATVSGTAALQVALLALGVGPGDEVVIPAVTWVGCADAVILCGAVPVPAQVDETLGLDARDVRRRLTPRTKAIMAVSLYGNPCDVASLQAVAAGHGVALLEDCCQAAGVSYRGHRLGSFGHAAVFSTNLMKFVAAGDGGFVATDRDEVYEYAVMFTGGKSFPARKRELGLTAPVIPFTTLRMNELTGAVALAQLQRLDALLARLRGARDAIFERVGEGRSFRRVAGNDPGGDAGWLTPLLFADEDTCQAFATAVRARGVPHVTTARERFAGGEIAHCYPVAAQEPFIPHAGAHWATRFRAMLDRTPLADGFMDESLAIVGRLAMIQTNPRLEPEHCRYIADAVRSADEEVAGATFWFKSKRLVGS